MHTPDKKFKMDRATKIAIAVAKKPQVTTGKYVGEATNVGDIKSLLISAQIAVTPTKTRRAAPEKAAEVAAA